MRRPGVILGIGAVAMTIFIGLRYNVGGDWDTYQFMYYRAGPLPFANALSIGDPAYQAAFADLAASQPEPAFVADWGLHFP